MGDHREEGEQTGKCHNKRSLTLDVQWKRHQMMGVMSGPLSTTQCRRMGRTVQMAWKSLREVLVAVCCLLSIVTLCSRTDSAVGCRVAVVSTVRSSCGPTRRRPTVRQRSIMATLRKRVYTSSCSRVVRHLQYVQFLSLIHISEPTRPY